MATKTATHTHMAPPPASVLSSLSKAKSMQSTMPLQPACINKKSSTSTHPLASSTSAPGKAKEQPRMHRRSRTGCFICRLRRKKCDEGKPVCRACRHLGLVCEYKRPLWWSNNEQRRQQKEIIKEIIKRTKLNEKHSQTATTTLNAPSPIGIPSGTTTTSSTTTTTIHTEAFGDEQGRNDSQFHLDYPPGMIHGYPHHHHHHLAGQDVYNSPALLAHQHAGSPFPSSFGMVPYEIDIKTERQTFLNEIPIRRDSTISSSYTSFRHHQPGLDEDPLDLPIESWVQHDYFESREESFGHPDKGSFDSLFDFDSITPGLSTSTGDSGIFNPATLELDETDQTLLTHFLTNVLPLIFPILEAGRPGAIRSDVVVPALESNETYLHCCLSYAALHLKESQATGKKGALVGGNDLGQQVADNDIMKHRYATISKLCEALNRDTDHEQILEATLAMIFFQCAVGQPSNGKDGLPDIPWHQHFQAATNLIVKLGYPDSVLCTAGPPPFSFSLAAWIDILGATMLGRAPMFADTYREKNLSGTRLGLAELTGCDDNIMFLISEIACLDALRSEGMDEVQLCTHIKLLGDHISLAELQQQSDEEADTHVVSRHKQLSRAMTAVFRTAARIYLCGLVPDFDRRQPSIINLVNSLTDAMNGVALVAAATDVSLHLLDRSLAWPLLIGGSIALRNSPFRHLLATRTTRMGPSMASFGSYGRVTKLLKDVWSLNDPAEMRGERSCVLWRDVMTSKGWDDLLI